jgi:hypothetical protein
MVLFPCSVHASGVADFFSWEIDKPGKTFNWNEGISCAATIQDAMTLHRDGTNRSCGGSERVRKV